MEKTIAILGSTGSIGTQTLEVVRENKDIRVAGLSAGSNITLLENRSANFIRRWQLSGMKNRQRFWREESAIWK